MPDGVSATVIGPSAILPRGYLWIAPIWILAAITALAMSPWPIWFRFVTVTGLLVSMLVFVLALNAITTHAFVADGQGVRLGLPGGTRRRGRRRREVKYLPWRQIERVRLAPRPYGTRVEFILGRNASLTLRGFKRNPVHRMIRGLLLLIPFWYLLRPTALTTPLRGPARYQVKLRGASVDDLRIRLRAVAPSEVAVAVLIRTG